MIVDSQLPYELSQLASTEELASRLPTKIILYGFADMSPAIEQCFLTLQKYCQILIVEQPRHNHQHDLQQFQNAQDELMAIAKWALAAHQQNPGNRILCVIPDLAHIKTDCLEAFLNVDPLSQKKINISSGIPLSHTAIGQSFLNIIKQNHYQIDFNTFTKLIKNHLWADQTTCSQSVKDYIAHQLLDADKPNLSLKQWINHLKQMHEPRNEPVIQYLQQWLQCRTKKSSQKQSFLYWLRYFTKELNALQWPGIEALSSEHYQQYQQLETVWQEFLTLDKLLPACDYQDALRYITLLCQQSLFAPESKDRPIHILGALEAHGLHYDQVWMSRLTLSIWPPKTKVNPLLPFALQKKYDMPNANHKKFINITNKSLKTSSPAVSKYS